MKSNKLKVALIDDNNIFRFIFENMLKDIADIEIDYKSYEHALAALEDFDICKKQNITSPDILFIDINMPFMSGWEMLNEIANDRSTYLDQSSIYMISSSDSKNDIDQFQNFPFLKGYILKPLSKETLLDILTINNQ